MGRNAHVSKSESRAPWKKTYVFRTPLLPCPYLADRIESRVAVDLGNPNASERYDQLSLAGFRRTGRFAYRPDCQGCSACVSVRVLAKEFVPSRTFCRIQNANADLDARKCPAKATVEQFRLFRDYQTARHPDGDMAAMVFSDYRTIVEDCLPETRLIEFRKPDRTLVLAGLIDWLQDGPSAVYSFFDPQESKRSLGTLFILWLIEQTRARGLPHVYLGYRIAGCPNMAYKARFQPLEGFSQNGWQRLGS